MQNADPIAARELTLFADNDRMIYFHTARPIIDNLAKKLAKGTYDSEKAQKLWFRWATEAAKRYAEEFATPSEWNIIFPVAVRRAAAADKEAHELGEMRLEAESDRLGRTRDGDKTCDHCGYGINLRGQCMAPRSVAD